jgi:S1-C subfamily serine protease
VGEDVQLRVERGGESIETSLTVQDLHAITPASYLETGGAIIHPLSYQQARNRGVPIEGLYLASGGYVFARAKIQRGVVITSLDGEPVDSLLDFETRWAAHPDGSKATVRYFEFDKPRAESLGVVTVDRRWFPMRLCVSDVAGSGWPCRASKDPLAAEARAPSATTFDADLPRPARDLAPSLVMVEFDVPFRIDGIHADRFKGAGLVVDAERGLVVVDRETVPVALGDVRLIFAASVEVPGEVVFIHPAHNLAVVAYDPKLLGDTAIRSAQLRPIPLEANDEVWIVGLSNDHEVVSRKSRVSTVETPSLKRTTPPRFRETNLEVVLLTDYPSTVGGVIADKKGRVHAFWASFSTGVPPQSYFAAIGVDRILDIVTPLRESRPVGWRSLGVELRAMTLAEGRSHGLSDAAARRLEEPSDGERRVLSIAGVRAGTPSKGLLKPGDLLLAVNGEPATTFDDVERAGRRANVEVTLLRDGKEDTLRVSTTPLDGRGTTRALLWAGALIQSPHLAIAEHSGIAVEGVYVAWFWYGSPANRYRLSATRRIVAVDNQEVGDLDAFLAAVGDRPDRSSVRLRTIGLDGRTDVITLKLDLEFWPTAELRLGDDGWERISHQQRPLSEFQ